MGEFIGSSFGFSVAATDLNNDGLDDLIVGAPQYYQYSNDGKYGGAVYVYINEENRTFRYNDRYCICNYCNEMLYSEVGLS